jgi:hypothetical protein
VLLATHASVFLAAFFRYDFSVVVAPSTRSSAERSGMEQYTRSEARWRGTVQMCTGATRVMRHHRHAALPPTFKGSIPARSIPAGNSNAIYVLIHVVYMIFES